MSPLLALWTFVRAWLFGSTNIALENLALRHQLAVLQRSVRRPTPLALGSGPLGLAVLGLGGLAVEPRHRPTGHCPRLAPPRLPVLLAVEVEDQPGRPPAA
jgi:hypothetical protein